MKIKVHVKPGTSQEKIIETDGGYIVYLRAKAHDGEANIALMKLLSKHLKVPKTAIKILHGEKGREKILEIYD